MTEQRIFKTLDAYLSGVITILLNLEPLYEVERGRTYFCYPASDELYRVMAEYNQGVKVNAIQFSSVVKRLRGEAISRRSGANNA